MHKMCLYYMSVEHVLIAKCLRAIQAEYDYYIIK